MLFKTDAEKAFGVETYLSPEMEDAIKLWESMERGNPPWLSDSDGRTISFSNTVARELAKLITQNIDIKVQPAYGSGEKAAFIQSAIDNHFLKNAQENMETVIRLGGIMAKWNGSGIDYIPPDRFLVTEFDSNKDIKGVIFFSFYQKEKKFYTRAEWHRFEDIKRKKTDLHNGEQAADNDRLEMETVKVYHVSNKAFVSDQQDQIGRETSLKKTKWADIVPEFTAENLEKPLYTYIKNPYSNTIDPDSPLGVSCFSECTEELRWLDIAMSTMGTETETSTPMLLVDQSVLQYADMHGIKLPKFLSKVGLDLTGDGKPVEEWQPTLQVANRIEGINFYLNVISSKTGFSNGYFSYNQKQGLVTATQVEADERQTINTMMMYRSILDRPNSNGDGRVGAIHDIAYVIDVMSVINGDSAPSEFGNYELFCEFDDPFQNTEEDRQRAYQLMIQGILPKWYYLSRYEGFTEDDAKKMIAEAQAEKPQESGLFGEE